MGVKRKISASDEKPDKKVKNTKIKEIKPFKNIKKEKHENSTHNDKNMANKKNDFKNKIKVEDKKLMAKDSTAGSKLAFKKHGAGGKKLGGFNKIKKLNEKSTPTALEKTDWKQLKLEKKKLLQKRKQQKPYYDLTVEMKKIYESVKCKSSKKNKEELSKKLYNLLKTNLKSFVMAHDTARIVQCVLKKASPDIKKELAQSLVPFCVEMATSKYAHFCVLRILNYGDKSTKSQLIDSLFGSIMKLTLNHISHTIIDTIFVTHASKKQKNMMKQEFYGDLYKNSKDQNIKKLADTYKDSPQLKSAILNAVKGNLEQIANKNVVDNSLVHAILYEYLTECEDAEFEEIIGMYSSKIPLLLTTQDGSKSAILLFWKATTKDRRAIVKSIKEHLIKICTHEYGHLFLIAVTNCMDDTKAINKSIFEPLFGKLHEVMQNQWGRNVIIWLLSPACTDNFHPKLIEYFNEGLKYGKKPVEIRRKEILEQIQEPLSNDISDNPEFWLSDGHMGLATATLIKNLSGNNFQKVAESLAKLITNPEWVCNRVGDNKTENSTNTQEEVSETQPGIEDSGLHIVLKKMIKYDQTRIKSNECTLGEFIVKNLTSDIVKSWIKINRARFILLNILENCTENTKNELSSLLQKHMKDLKAQNNVGAKLLLNKLTENE